MQLIGIDIGTHSTKGILVTVKGEVIAKAVSHHAVESPRPGWAEQDAEKIWWAETIELIRRLLDHPGARPPDVAGICVSGLFPALLLADTSGQPLRPALLYSDDRAGRLLQELNQTFGLTLTGDAIPHKLAWLRDHEPEIFQQMRYIFSSHNYIVYRLTGTYCLDYKVADAWGGLLDRATLAWREDVASWAGVDPAILPRLWSLTQIAGTLTAEVAAVTGLKPSVQVAVGSGDTLLALMSANVVDRGEALLSFGTTGWMAVLPEDLVSFLHQPQFINQGAPYLLRAYLLSLGSALQWFRDQLADVAMTGTGRLNVADYQMLDEQAAKIAPAAEGLLVLPYFSGQREPDIPNLKTASILGLTLSHTSSHLYRALLESFGYVVRSAIDQLALEGLPIRRIVCVGGGATSDLWRQIICDIIHHPLIYYKDVSPCLGNAFLAGYALGLWNSLQEISAWLPPPSITQPSADPNTRRLYDQAYTRFFDLRSALNDEIYGETRHEVTDGHGRDQRH